MTMMQKLRDGHPIRVRWKFHVDWPVFWIGQLWWLFETAHFGWNLSPQSDAEMICDGIVALITALSFRGSVSNG